MTKGKNEKSKLQDTGPDRYFDEANQLTVVKLYSGDYYATAKPGEMIMTILGSCVAACVRDPQLGIGGMNHFLLPGESHYDTNSLDPSARYGAFAMEKLINEILKLGGKRDRLEVKVFGGANVINNSSMIGAKNVDFIRRYLKEEGLRIAKEDLGGTHPRRLHYYPDTGKVMLRSLKRKEELPVLEEESAYEQKLIQEQMGSKQPKSGLELF